MLRLRAVIPLQVTREQCSCHRALLLVAREVLLQFLWALATPALAVPSLQSQAAQRLLMARVAQWPLRRVRVVPAVLSNCAVVPAVQDPPATFAFAVVMVRARVMLSLPLAVARRQRAALSAFRRARQTKRAAASFCMLVQLLMVRAATSPLPVVAQSWPTVVQLLSHLLTAVEKLEMLQSQRVRLTQAAAVS